MNAIEIKNLTLKIKNKVVLDNININFSKGNIQTVLGPNSSYKTLLFNAIKKNKKGITINGNCTFISNDINSQVVGKTVKDQLLFFMRLNNYTDRKMNSRLKKVIDLFGINDILNEDPFDISYGYRQLVVVLSLLMLDKDIFIIDDAFNMLDNINREKMFNYIKSKKKTTFIHFTNNSEDILYGTNTIIFNRKVIKKDKTNKIITNEKLFLNNNLSLPFMADLSNKLKYYNLFDKVIIDQKEMVDELWN